MSIYINPGLLIKYIILQITNFINETKNMSMQLKFKYIQSKKFISPMGKVASKKKHSHLSWEQEKGKTFFVFKPQPIT